VRAEKGVFILIIKNIFINCFVISLLLISACTNSANKQDQVQNGTLIPFNIGESELESEIDQDTSTNSEIEIDLTNNQEIATETKHQSGIEIVDEEHEQTEDKTQLQDKNPTHSFPFNELIDRWNAISYELTAEHFITSFQHVSEENEFYFRTFLNDELELRVYVHNDYIHRLQIRGFSTTQEKRYSMLTSWWQTFLLTNPSVSSSDIDLLFSEIGIEPSANLNEVKEQSFTYGEISYSINLIGNGHIFDATYPLKNQ
jgi:hypothetical protein